MNRTEKSTVAKTPAELLHDEIETVVQAEHADPFGILGPHWTGPKGSRSLVIRAFRPGAKKASVLWGPDRKVYPATLTHPGGVFEAILRADTPSLREEEPVSPTKYRLQFEFADAAKFETYDPYAFAQVLSEYDLYLSGEGTHYEKYEKLGAHVREVAGVRGVHFAVWAPNAQRVSVVGDFNLWDGRANPMRNLGPTGIWEIFMPGLDEGALYKFEILSRVAHHLGLKSDPYGFSAEMRPNTASVVFDINRYQWNDSHWLADRKARDWQHSPMSIYEIHAGSWKRR